MTMIDWLRNKIRHESKILAENSSKKPDYNEGRRDAFFEALNYFICEADNDVTLKELQDYCSKHKMCTEKCKFNVGGWSGRCTVKLTPCGWDIPRIEEKMKEIEKDE